MKKLYILLLLVVTSFGASATTYTSAQNGNWMNPTTWSPIGIPLPGDNITINHVVTMDTSFAYSTGSISVLGTLTQDAFGRDLWLSGASAQFTSSGIVTLRNILVSQGTFTNSGTLNVDVVANFGTFTNNDSMLGVDSLYNDGIFSNNMNLRVTSFFNNDTFNNNGTIQGQTVEVDSMYNNGTFINAGGALIVADSCTNASSFTNNGVINFDQFTNWVGTFTNTNYMSFVDMTNVATFINQDSLIGAGSVTNTGDLDNQAGAYFSLAISFLNADFINFDALFTANGRFEIGDSFYNYDGITGTAPGSIQVQDTSYNHTTGTFTGSFDFCDLTPPVSPIKIDFNLGSVGASVTFCTWTGLNENIEDLTGKIYPNPTNGILNFDFEEKFSINIYNAIGELVITTTETSLDISNFQNGVYFLFLKDEKGELIKQEKIIKH